MKDTRTSDNGHQNNKSPVNPAILKQFFADYPGGLLSTFLKEGMSQFSYAFTDLFRIKSKFENRFALQPQHVIPTFNGYFNDHRAYFDLAKSVYAELGGGITKDSIEFFMASIADHRDYDKLENSGLLNDDLKRIICLCVPGIEKSSRNSGKDIFSDVLKKDNEVIPASTPVGSKNVGGAITDPIRQKVNDFMTSALDAIVAKGDTLAPSNPDIRKAIIEEYPELATWVDDKKNKEWIKGRLSILCDKRNLTAPRAAMLIERGQSTPLVRQVLVKNLLVRPVNLITRQSKPRLPRLLIENKGNPNS